jgi:hypothetical protein
MITSTIALAACLVADEFSLAGSQLETKMLSNGVVVAIARVECENEYFALFHRGGLLDDDLGETQWSHLLEHLVIRTTDQLDDVFISDQPPPELIVQPNGETGAHVLRLEAIFRVADAEPLAKLAPRAKAWMQFQIAGDHAAAEAARAIEELNFAERTGHAHKWALAAWNQARRGATTVELRGAIANAKPESLAAAASRMRARHPPLLLLHGGIEAQRAHEFASSIPVAAPEPGVEDPSRAARSLPNPNGAVSWDLALDCIVAACDVPAATPTQRLAGLCAAELLQPAFVRAAARDLRNPLMVFETGDQATTGRLLITALIPPGGNAERARGALERMLAALAAELADDPETAADNLDAVRRRSFGARARITFGKSLVSDPYAGAQTSIDGAYHRILLGVVDDSQLEAAYREYDPDLAATELGSWLAPERWSWLSLEAKK